MHLYRIRDCSWHLRYNHQHLQHNQQYVETLNDSHKLHTACWCHKWYEFWTNLFGGVLYRKGLLSCHLSIIQLSIFQILINSFTPSSNSNCLILFNLGNDYYLRKRTTNLNFEHHTQNNSSPHGTKLVNGENVERYLSQFSIQ